MSDEIEDDEAERSLPQPQPQPNPNSISPLTEIDPESIDETFQSIDKKFSLGLPREISDKEIDKVVDYYWSLREKFMKEIQLGNKPPRAQKTSNKNILDSFKNIKL